MDLLIQRDSPAHDVFIAVVIIAVAGELSATYFGQARDGKHGLFGSVLESTLLLRRGDDATAEDRWTKQILIGTILAGLIAAYLVADRVPSLRAGANDWATLTLGACIALAGIVPRSWAVSAAGSAPRSCSLPPSSA
jgi:hypothetical protein